MSIVVIEVVFNQLLLAGAVVPSSESVHYSNCKECVDNNNNNDDGMVLSALKELMYTV